MRPEFSTRSSPKIVAAGADRRDPAADRARLEEIAGELANLVRLAAKVGHLDAHARVLRELEGEKAEIEQRLSTTPSRSTWSR